MKLQPLYIIPILIEQPTWGGYYIAEFKHITSDQLSNSKIGQSYELSSHNMLHTDPTKHIYALGNPDAPSQATLSSPVDTVSITQLVKDAAVDTLGSKVVDQHGTTFPLLIKFTQAQENSYQLHVKPGQEFGSWQAKPESWYYLEKGKATLGLRDTNAVAAYKQRCTEIDEFAKQLSAEVKSGKLSLSQAQTELQSFIEQDHPHNYVNTVYIEPGQVIDLSTGGVHHSWEADPSLPLGNIVYEVQVDVLDNVSTLRSFDQGKMKSDGSIRTLTIPEYFQALDTSTELNEPSSHMQYSDATTDQGAQIQTVFSNQYYQTHKLSLTQDYSGEHCKLDGTFHHLFCLNGQVEVGWRGQRYPLEKGWSLFIPAACQEYQIHTTAPAQILQSLPAVTS